MVSQNGAVNAEKLTVFSTKVLEKMGIPEEDARITAGILVATDLRGIDSHGVAHLGPFYVQRIKDGLINVKPDIKVFSQSPATAIMDGDRGLGFVVGYRAMMEAMRRADATGAGFVSVRNSTHYGAGSNYAMMALPRNMIGISLNTGGKAMAAPGSFQRGVCMNVISIAAPAQKEAPFVLDMAAAVVAAGKIEIARRLGKKLPEGWAIDKEGKPITDPERFYQERGAILPLGGKPQTGAYKGFGLAVAVDILCSILSGSLSSARLYDRPDKRGSGTHFFGALRIDGFLPAEDFKKNMDDLVDYYRNLPRAPGVEKIYLAGEMEQEIEKKRRADGIPLDPVVIASLKKLSQELSIPYDL